MWQFAGHKSQESFKETQYGLKFVRSQILLGPVMLKGGVA
eukprot:gene17413-23055_t